MTDRFQGKCFYLWCTASAPPLRLPTYDGHPLSERDADVLASKFDPRRRVVVRPATPKDITESLEYIDRIRSAGQRS
jgi:hypothetical protein